MIFLFLILYVIISSISCALLQINGKRYNEKYVKGDYLIVGIGWPLFIIICLGSIFYHKIIMNFANKIYDIVLNIGIYSHLADPDKDEKSD